MQLYKLHDRTYFLNKDKNGKEIVFYSDKDTLYQPRCSKESTLQVLDYLSNCYGDLPIKLTKYNFTGFLQQDRFIINSSRKRDCSTVDRQYSINSSLIIQQKGMQIILQFVAARSLYETTPYQLEHEATDFSHHPLRTSNFDPIGMRESKDSVFDNGNVFELVPENLSRQNSSYEVIVDNVTSGWNSLVHTTVKWLFVLLALITTLVVGLYVFRYKNQQFSISQDVNEVVRKLQLLSTINRPVASAPSMPNTPRRCRPPPESVALMPIPSTSN
jgi:hypothetical protein